MIQPYLSGRKQVRCHRKGLTKGHVFEWNSSSNPQNRRGPWNQRICHHVALRLELTHSMAMACNGLCDMGRVAVWQESSLLASQPANQLAGQPSNGYFKSPTTVTGGSTDNSDTSQKKASGSDNTDNRETCKRVRATAPTTQNVLYLGFC